MRWRVILPQLSFREAFLINSANIFLNNLLPARTGELSWFYYASRLGVNFKGSLWSFFLGRAYDLMGILYLFLLLYAWELGTAELFVSIILVVFLSAILPLGVHLLPEVRKIKELKAFLRRNLNVRLSLVLSFLSTSSFFLKAVSIYVLLLPMLDLSLLKFCIAFAGGELTTILPVHGFMGYGTYEAGFIIPLKTLGIELKDSLRLAFISHTFLLIASSIWGILSIILLHTLSRKSP